MNNGKITRWALPALAGFLVAACDMDLTDPNSPNEEDVITTAAGLRQVAIGLQATYFTEVRNPVYITGLVTDELGAIVPAFESFRNVDAARPVENSTGPSTETWAGLYRVIHRANVLLDNVPDVAMVDGTRSGIQALAKLKKAMAFGGLLQTYERIPLEVGVHDEHPQFASRQEGLNTVLQLLGEARQQIQSLPPSAEFNNEVIAPGFDLANTIDAMIARYSLIAGDLGGAMTAAERVNPGVLSELRGSSAAPNSLWVLWLGSGNAWAMRPKQAFRLQAEEGDQRVGYWVTEASIAGETGTLDQFSRYADQTASFPIYLPGEMLLIQAEVHARQNDLDAARALINQVRTQCSSTVDEPVACLPELTEADLPTQQAVLDQILHERRYELFLQGVRWSDLRRFDRPVKFSYMMVSRPECERNRNAPAELCALTTNPN